MTHPLLYVCVLVRMGKKEGFKNIKRSQVHSVGTKAMKAMACNIHENVPEYDQVRGQYDLARH